MLMGSYPFAAQIVKVTKNVVGFKEKIPIVTTSSFSFDIVKLLISALIKSAVVSVLLRIFVQFQILVRVSYISGELTELMHKKNI